jgi:hypothetical protein
MKPPTRCAATHGRTGCHQRLAAAVVALATLPGLAALPGAATAREQARPFTAAIAHAIESCVGGPAIRFLDHDRRAMLDAADAAAVNAALTQRYPVVAHDGLGSSRIVLWRKPGAEWLYVLLLENPMRADELCFTATFRANRFDLTAPLIVKYFGTAIANE